MKALHGKLIDDENLILDASITTKTNDVIYQNTSNRPVMVCISVMAHLEDATGGLGFFIDKRAHVGSTSAIVTARTNEVSRCRPFADLGATVDAEFTQDLVFIVPPKFFYNLESFSNNGAQNGFTIYSWKEYEL